MKTLDELAARVEALTGACRRVDARIYMALNPTEQTIIGHKPGRFPQEPIYGPITDLADMAENSQDPRDIADFICAPHFTASLDAAMTLLPGRMPWEVRYPANDDGSRSCHGIPTKPTADVGGIFGRAATPALALTAAALRALAAQDKESTDDRPR